MTRRALASAAARSPDRRCACDSRYSVPIVGGLRGGQLFEHSRARAVAASSWTFSSAPAQRVFTSADWGVSAAAARS